MNAFNVCWTSLIVVALSVCIGFGAFSFATFEGQESGSIQPDGTKTTTNRITSWSKYLQYIVNWADQNSADQDPRPRSIRSADDFIYGDDYVKDWSYLYEDRDDGYDEDDTKDLDDGNVEDPTDPMH